MAKEFSPPAGSTTRIEAPQAAQLASLLNQCPDLWRSEKTITGRVLKRLASTVGESPSGSNTQTVDGIDLYEHPFSLSGAASLRGFNPHHGACLDKKPKLMVGGGFASGEGIEDVLDPICGNGSFIETLLSAEDNRNEFGNGYIEVVREDPVDVRSRIVGIHWVEAPLTWKVQCPLEEGTQRARPHLDGYAVSSPSAGPIYSLAPGGYETRHAPFGRPKEFAEAHNLTEAQIAKMSEIIEISGPKTRGHQYRIPGWLGVIPALELINAGLQHEFDYFYNRGMPYWMLLLLGQEIETDKFNAMKSELNTHVGVGNTHKGAVFNLAGDGEQLNSEMFQLGSNETQRSRFVENANEMGHWIVTAHTLPPRLMGIVLPGKIGAVNEAVTDVWLAEVTSLNPERKMISRKLACTLGNPDLNGGLGLTQRDFLGATKRKGNGFLTLLEDENVAALNGTARMDDPVVTSDRDPEQGRLENGQQREAQTSDVPSTQ